MKNDAWDISIQPHTGWFELNLTDLWKYRDLLFLFVKRDFVTLYKQTILGPLWYIIQPLFTTLVFTVIFGKIAKIPTDNLPPFLFYLAGNIVWSFFTACLTKTSNTFIANAGIFGKVYFPRLILPISAIIISFIQFLIQFSLFLGFLFYFSIKGAPISPSLWVLTLPLLLLQMGLLGLGTGILISSLTTKYRDLQFAMNFFVQLWMYATPIVYPLKQIPEKYRILCVLNPMAPIVESFRFAFLGVGTLRPYYHVIGWTVTLSILALGMILFTRIEKTFMDTI